MDPAEREIVTRLRRGARAGNALLALRKEGFLPDILCASASMGGSFYVRDIFPKAFYVGQADWLYTQGESHCFFTRGKPRPAADFALARVANLWEYNALGECDLAVTRPCGSARSIPTFWPAGCMWHTAASIPAFFRLQKIRKNAAASLSVSGPPHESARGFQQFIACLPRLLEQRPNCLVLLMAGTAGRGTPGMRGRQNCAQVRKKRPRAVWTA